MGNRTAKFVSALVGSIIAGAPLAAVSQNAPSASSTADAASDCLASPKGSAPQGQHWHYRVERGTKRQCWYLRAEGSKDSAKPVQTAQATSDTPAADLPSPAPQQHVATDARAEYLTPRSAAPIKTPSPVAQAATATQPQQSADQTATSDAQQPASAAPWPDVAAASNPPTPEPAPAAQASAKPSKSSLPMALATADGSADKPTGSLQMLLLVVGGALALAGILASVIYRFAGARVRANDQRRVNWDDREPQHQDRAPWLNAMPATPRARQPRPIDFDAVRPKAAQLAAIDHEIDVIEAHEPPAAAEAAQHDANEIPVFDREFEIETGAPRLAANEAAQQHDDRNEDAVDIDIITTMLERLLNEGPRLSPASPEAELAALAQSRQGRSAARA